MLGDRSRARRAGLPPRCCRTSRAGLALPLGALELGALLVLLMRARGDPAPLGQAVALFAGGWLVAQLLGHAGFPLLRLGYAEEGGELGRLGARRRRVARRRRARRRRRDRVRAAAAGRAPRRRRAPGAARDHAARGARRRARRGRPRRHRRARERRHDQERLGRRRRERDHGRRLPRHDARRRLRVGREARRHPRPARRRDRSSNCSVDMLGNELRPGDRHLVHMGYGHEHGRGLQRRRRHGRHRHALVDDARSRTTT